jgi:hypothetical protein
MGPHESLSKKTFPTTTCTNDIGFQSHLKFSFFYFLILDLRPKRVKSIQPRLPKYVVLFSRLHWQKSKMLMLGLNNLILTLFLLDTSMIGRSFWKFQKIWTFIQNIRYNSNHQEVFLKSFPMNGHVSRLRYFQGSVITGFLLYWHKSLNESIRLIARP